MPTMSKSQDDDANDDNYNDIEPATVQSSQAAQDLLDDGRENKIQPKLTKRYYTIFKPNLNSVSYQSSKEKCSNKRL